MNQLKVNQQHTIVSLFGQGWSKRRIARELDLDRATVRKYLAARTAKSPAHPQTGSVANPGPASLCDPWRAQIAAAFAAGLSVQRIYQDLVVEHQFAGSYHAVRRFVLRQHGGAASGIRQALLLVRANSAAFAKEMAAKNYPPEVKLAADRARTALPNLPVEAYKKLRTVAGHRVAASDSRKRRFCCHNSEVDRCLLPDSSGGFALRSRGEFTGVRTGGCPRPRPSPRLRRC